MPITLICIHCSATKASQDIGFAEIDQWHKARGWKGFGYSECIRRDGSIEKGRPEGATLAHANGYNRDAIAICLVGGIDDAGRPEANFTPEQMATLRAEVDRLSAKYPEARICGHRDLPGVKKACPSFDVAHWLATGAVSGEGK